MHFSELPDCITILRCISEEEGSEGGNYNASAAFANNNTNDNILDLCVSLYANCPVGRGYYIDNSGSLRPVPDVNHTKLNKIVNQFMECDLNDLFVRRRCDYYRGPVPKM